MEYSSFFNAILDSDGKPDRAYKAEDWDRHLKDLISNGIFAGGTNLQVAADGSGMSVVLNIGAAWINGKHYLNDQAITFQIDAADGALNRADRIVIRLDTAGRYIKAQYKKGSFASTAVPPDLQRDADGWELCLADVSIPAGTTAISQSLITDTRLDNDVCGIVTGVVDQADTTTLYAQIQDDLARFRSVNEADFTAWVNGLKGILDDETAGNLLNLITEHKADTNNPHQVTPEQIGAVQGNAKAWVATEVSTSEIYITKLTIPHFEFSEGCTITFKSVISPTDSEPEWANRIIIYDETGKQIGVYALSTLSKEPVSSDAWAVGAMVTVTLSSEIVGTWGNLPTAFFKQGGYGTLAAQINNFYATIGDASVRLTWSNPPDSNYAGVVIIRKTGGYPSKVLDGTKIYEGSGTSVTDTGLANGTQYFYRAFAYNSKHEYQTEYCVATMTPLHGYQLGTFPVGTKLKFGSIFGNPIVMKIANKSGSDITLIADGVLARYAFDAKEPSNSITDRKNYGNNRYVLSNIHQWLNSEAGAGSWYVAQHSADQAPDSTSVVSENPYKSAAGFLNGFSVKEKNYLKTKTITVGRSNTDGGGTETLNARICLPSGTEVGLSTDYTEGSQFQAFSDNNSRIAYETADCAANTGGTAGAAQYYWLRTPYASNANYVRVVYSDGMLYSDYAYNGTYGVRPLCFLDSSVLLSLTLDADGCYTLA